MKPPSLAGTLLKPVIGPDRNKSGLLRLTLVALERHKNDDLTAQYNPKEIQFDKTLTWNAGANNKHDLPQVEFSSTAARTLSMELLFDTYEEDNVDVMDQVRRLQWMCDVMEPDARGNEQDKRPTLVQVVWGKPELPVFEGVIASLTTKLTMFLPSGLPVRATCGVKIMEAARNFAPERKTRAYRTRTQW
jgi:hypothetical protein